MSARDDIENIQITNLKSRRQRVMSVRDEALRYRRPALFRCGLLYSTTIDGRGVRTRHLSASHMIGEHKG